MQTVINRWEGLLRATGGALVPKKSHWYFVDFLWTGTDWRYKKAHECPGVLTVVDTNGLDIVPLTRHEVDHAEETLGVYIAMDGNNNEETQALRHKAIKFASNIRSTFTDPEDAWYALKFSFWKTLEYPLIAVTMTLTQWNRVISPALMDALPRANIDRHFPRSILHAPTRYQGLGLPHPWHMMQVEHLITLLEQTAHKSSLTGGLLIVSLEQLRLELGIEGPFFSRSYYDFKGIITPCWISSLW